MSIITISRQVASGGDEIAYQLCQELQYGLFDKHLIVQAAIEAGICEQDIIDYTEDNHQVRGFFDRLFESAPVLPYAGIWPDDGVAQYTFEELRIREECFQLIQNAIRYSDQVGNMVIVGRGGQALLKDRPGVIHVRVIAPTELRTQRVKEQLKGNAQDISPDLDHRFDIQARDYVTQRDAASADFLKHYYHVDWADPMLYHLVLNTGKLSIPQAVQTILLFAESLRTPEQVSDQFQKAR
jgi:cytidylate kinase